MGEIPFPPAVIAIAAVLCIAALALAVLLVLWWRKKPPSPDGPDPGEPVITGLDPHPASVPFADFLRKTEDALVRRLGQQAEMILDVESRLKSELLEGSCRMEILVDAVRQNSKELAVVEQLLRDIVQILNISIAESKGVSQKLQKHLDGEPKTPPTQKLTPFR